MKKKQIIEIFTDGSCNTKLNIGAWAAIIFLEGKKKIIEGIEKETTHNRMELIAVIEAIDYVEKTHANSGLIRIFTDSQYVEKIPSRKQKLIAKNFKTNKGTDIQNKDLIQSLILRMQQNDVEFIKVRAHQKSTSTVNYNREVDKHARKLVRQEITRKNDTTNP